MSNASDSGTLGDGITKVNTLTLTGTAAANATVKLYDTDGTTVLGTATADNLGNWSITTSSPLGNGAHTLRVTQTDSFNQTSPLSDGLKLTIDTVAPKVLSIHRVGAETTNAKSVEYTLTFDSAITGVSPDDFQFTGGGITASIDAVSGSDTTYTVTVNHTSGDGTLRLDLKNAGTSITNAAGNAASGYTAGQSYNFDFTAPTVAITSNPSKPSTLKAGETATITFTFSEDPGSTFDKGDIRTSGGTLSELSGTGKVWTAVFTPTEGSTGKASITVAANAYTDAAGNSGLGGGKCPNWTSTPWPQPPP